MRELYFFILGCRFIYYLFDIRDKFTDMMTYDMTRTQIYESLALATSTNVGIEAKNLMTLLNITY